MVEWTVINDLWLLITQGYTDFSKKSCFYIDTLVSSVAPEKLATWYYLAKNSQSFEALNFFSKKLSVNDVALRNYSA